MTKKDVIVRAYDLGGFGDIAGALRVTDYLARQGKSVGVLPIGDSARTKLNVLAPNYSHAIKDGVSSDLVVDVAGHYGDSRVGFSIPVPHLFIEDMDNSPDRQSKVPLYIKTGLVNKGVSDDVKSCGVPTNPLFYRPFSEEEIPARKDLDPLELMVQQLFRRNSVDRCSVFLNKIVCAALDGVSKIGFAYYRPDVNTCILVEAYIRTLKSVAKDSTGERFAVGLFLSPDKEAQVIQSVENQELNCVSHQHTVIKDPNFLTLVLLGPTPQLETSKMFLSATIPPQVTGDLSLSDALYFLIARDGQGFFYDCPNWKKPTRDELEKLIGNDVARIFRYDCQDVRKVFSDQKSMDEYRKNMRVALEAEIRKRFGAINLVDGRIQYGTPFLFQDAAGLSIDALINNKELRARVENTRERISPQKTKNNTNKPVPAQVSSVVEAKKYTGEDGKDIQPIKYNGLEIEQVTLRASCGCCKEFMTYDHSLARIKSAGRHRHLRSDEAFGLIAECLEGKLIPDLKQVQEDMITKGGEWLSLAFENKGNILIAYIDPEGLIWNGNEYIKKDFKYAEKIEIDIKGKQPTSWIELKKFKDEFTKFVYGRPFKELPKKMQDACVYLPPKDKIWPVGRGGYDYDVVAYVCNVRASRGVVVGAKNFSTGN